MSSGLTQLETPQKVGYRLGVLFQSIHQYVFFSQRDDMETRESLQRMVQVALAFVIDRQLPDHVEVEDSDKVR